MNAGQVLLDGLFEYLDIALHADHLRVVIQRQNRLDKHGKHPEGFLLKQYFNQSSKNEIHALTVTDDRVPLCVGYKDFPDGGDDPWQLELSIIWKGSLQIDLYLMEAGTWVVWHVIGQGAVVSLILWV